MMAAEPAERAECAPGDHCWEFTGRSKHETAWVCVWCGATETVVVR